MRNPLSVSSRNTLFLAGFLGLLQLSCATSGARANAGPSDPLSRIETLGRILVLEDSRSLGGGALISFLKNPDPSVRRRAVLAAGRIGDPLALPGLIAGLKDAEVEVRRAAAQALGFLGSADSVAALTASLSDADPLTRGRAAEALGRMGGAASGPLIAEAFLRAVPKTPAGVLKIRGDDPGRADDPWVELRLHLAALARLKDGESLARAVIGSDASPFIDWWVAVWAAARVGDRKLTPVLLTGVSAEDPYIRSLAARGLGTLKDPTHLALLRRLAEDREPSVVREAVRASVLIGGAEAAAIAAAHLDSSNLIVRREALLALGSLPPASPLRAKIIDNVGHQDAWIRAAAWPALIRIDAEDVGLVLSTIGPDSDWRVRQSVATALGENLGERAAPLLLPMLKDEDVRVIPAVLAALVRARGGDAAATLIDHVSHPDMGVRAAAVLGLSSLPPGERRVVEALNRAFDASLSDEDVETRINIVDAAAKEAGTDGLGLLRRIAGSDPSRVVRQRAMNRLGDGMAPADRSAIRAAEARRLVSLYEPGAEALYSPRVLISTRYGAIEIALDVVDAPLNSLAFVRLARSGFFNGLTFHRVVPGFVAQGGDPRGDGYGGPGFTVRCEYSGRPFGRGAVGMATAGKDTGGSQFFITLDPQPHLDGAYTQFGQVLSGMEAVEKLRPGDTILRVDVFDGREPS